MNIRKWIVSINIDEKKRIPIYINICSVQARQYYANDIKAKQVQCNMPYAICTLHTAHGAIIEDK